METGFFFLIVAGNAPEGPAASRCCPAAGARRAETRPQCRSTSPWSFHLPWPYSLPVRTRARPAGERRDERSPRASAAARALERRMQCNDGGHRTSQRHPTLRRVRGSVGDVAIIRAGSKGISVGGLQYAEGQGDGRHGAANHGNRLPAQKPAEGNRAERPPDARPLLAPCDASSPSDCSRS
jgi:hypothetical protein